MSDEYAEGYKEGFKTGYSAGYAEGKTTRYDEAKERAYLAVDIVMNGRTLAKTTTQYVKDTLETQVGRRQ